MASHRTGRRSTLDGGAEFMVAHLQGQGPRHVLLPFQAAVSRHFLLCFFQTGIRLVPFIPGKFVEVQNLHERRDGVLQTTQTAGSLNGFRNIFITWQ